MNWVDVVIVVVVAASAVYSLQRGVLRPALGLIGLVAGIYCALSYYERLAEALGTYLSLASLALLISFVLILIAVLVVFGVLASAAHRALKALGLAWADQLAGIVVGLAAGVFFSVCFLLILVRIPVPSVNGAIGQSTAAALIFKMLPHLGKLLPGNLRIFRHM